MLILGGIGAGIVGGTIGAAGRGEGKVNSTADGFIGVNTGAARDYVRDICGTAIKAAIKAAKDTKALFNVFDWYIN